ncbi:MAG: hypothetical protein HYZ29_03125 [Myxococcales bacterium]|nr:hypothetical protein [Myxococcales bacterium]
MRLRKFALLCATGVASLACAARPPAPEPASPAGPQSSPQGYSPSPEQPSSTTSPKAEDERRESVGSDGAGFSTVAEAEAALDQANAELNPKTRADKTSDGKPKRPSDSPAPKPAATGAPQGSAPDRCVNACKAFASLKRAAAAVCRLAGEGDARCKRAQAIVQDNEVRVAVCKCPGNGE